MSLPIPTDVWIVHDGPDDSCQVLGLGTDFEAALGVVSERYVVDHESIVIEFPYSDAASIKALIGDRYQAVSQMRERRFALTRETIRERGLT